MDDFTIAPNSASGSEPVPSKDSTSNGQHTLLADLSLMFNLNPLTSELLTKALGILGEYTDVARVYLFEDSEDGLSTQNTYEWVNEGVTPQIDNLQKTLYSVMPSFKPIVYGEGTLLSYDVTELPQDLRDVLEPQEIKSILVLPVFASGNPIGFIGFDETRRQREWDVKDVSLLKTISGILGNAISRQRAEDALQQKIQDLEKINKVMIDRELKMVALKEELGGSSDLDE